MIGIGVITLAVGFMVDSHRAWFAFLGFTFFLLSLTLAGTFFAAIQYISGAKWSVVLRRIPETTVAVLPVIGVLLLIVVAGTVFHLNHMYHWADKAAVMQDTILQKKAGYLNTPFWAIRIIIYIIAWFILGNQIRKMSVAQDASKNAETRKTLVKWSAAYVLTFAYTFTLASIDLVMSLEPHWFTTMFPVYAFSNAAYAGVAGMIIILVTIQGNGGLKDVTDEHMHDMGKFLFMFTVFWAYIAFSQHMLTWYANLPEETIYLEKRLKGIWGVFTVLLWIFHFVVPFFILLSRDIKRNGKRLVKVAWLILFMGFADVVWMVHGGMDKPMESFPLGWMEVGLFIGAIGLFGYVFFKAYAKSGMAPVGDPNYAESTHFHQTF